MKAIKYILIVIGIVAPIILGWWFGGKYNMERLEQMLTQTETVTQYDTVIQQQTDTLIIRKNDVKTYYYNSIDTIIITKEFEKSIDTTIEQSRIQVSYYFPQDSFKLKLNLAIKEITKTDSIKVYIPKIEYKNNVQNNLRWGVGGVLTGVLIGVIATR